MMGIEPRTWSEAIQLRIQKQEGQKGVPNGWSNRFPNGSIYDVKVIKNDGSVLKSMLSAKSYRS